MRRPFKLCTQCGEVYPATTEFFFARKGGRDGLRSDCRTCSMERNRLYREAHDAEYRAYQAQYRAANRDHLLAYEAAHRAERREQKAEASRQYYREHTAEVSAYHKAYRETHQAERAERHARYAAEHRDEIVAYRVAYYEQHAEETRKRARDWAASNPDRRAEQQRNRRARKRGAGGTHTAGDVTAQMERQRGRCYWCRAATRENYHVDHVVPLALGGSNGPENIVIACPTCNLKKGAKHPSDWAGVML